MPPLRVVASVEEAAGVSAELVPKVAPVQLPISLPAALSMAVEQVQDRPP